jgi:hypothetical protein
LKDTVRVLLMIAACLMLRNNIMADIIALIYCSLQQDEAVNQDLDTQTERPDERVIRADVDIDAYLD